MSWFQMISDFHPISLGEMIPNLTSGAYGTQMGWQAQPPTPRHRGVQIFTSWNSDGSEEKEVDQIPFVGGDRGVELQE